MAYSARQVSILQDERTNDPLGRSYSGMDDPTFLGSITTVDRTRNRSTMSASEVYNSVDQTEWAALSATEQQEIWDILHMGSDLDPFGREASRFTAIFPGAGATLTALAAARVENITRAEEIGLPNPNLGDVGRTS